MPHWSLLIVGAGKTEATVLAAYMSRRRDVFFSCCCRSLRMVEVDDEEAI